MKSVSLVALCFVSGLLSFSKAQAQCPAGTVDPLQIIDGQTWIFQTSDTLEASATGQGAIGKFTAKYVPANTNPGNPFPSGMLTITESVNSLFGVTRLATASGKYTINPDCSGGTLLFMLKGQAAQFQFVFASHFAGMYLLSVEDLPYHNVLSGIAKLGSAAQCPAGTANPINLLNGAKWSFSTYGSAFVAGTGPSVGIFTPTMGGRLAITETISRVSNGSPAVLLNASGAYTINGDCSGGTMTFLSGVQAVQYEFLFVDSNFSEMYMLSDDVEGSFSGPLVGQAKRV